MYIDLLPVVCAANGNEPHKRGKQSFEEGGRADNERLLRSSNQICFHPAEKPKKCELILIFFIHIYVIVIIIIYEYICPYCLCSYF